MLVRQPPDRVSAACGIALVVAACALLLQATTAASATKASGRIAFVMGDTIRLTSASGGRIDRLGRFDPTRSTVSFAWAPNGQRVAVVWGFHTGPLDVRAEKIERYVVFTLRADGSDLRRVSPARADDEAPAWSPDGRRIAFERWAPRADGQRDWGSTRLHVTAADGKSPRMLVRCAEHCHPAWSPDAQWIAYAAPGAELRLIRPDGSGGRLLVRGTRGSRPAWSPDGRSIAFAGTDDGLYVATLGGSRARRVARGLSSGATPKWSPDGRTLLFAVWRPPHDYVVSVPAHGGRARRLGVGSEPDWSPTGAWVAYGSDRDWGGVVVVRADGTDTQLIVRGGRRVGAVGGPYLWQPVP